MLMSLYAYLANVRRKLTQYFSIRREKQPIRVEKLVFCDEIIRTNIEAGSPLHFLDSFPNGPDLEKLFQQ